MKFKKLPDTNKPRDFKAIHELSGFPKRIYIRENFELSYINRNIKIVNINILRPNSNIWF